MTKVNFNNPTPKLIIFTGKLNKFFIGLCSQAQSEAAKSLLPSTTDNSLSNYFESLLTRVSTHLRKVSFASSSFGSQKHCVCRSVCLCVCVYSKRGSVLRVQWPIIYIYHIYVYHIYKIYLTYI